MLEQNQSDRPVLTPYQTEKIEVALSLIAETREEIKQKDFHTAVLLGVAANNCKQVIENDLPEGYIKPVYTRIEVEYEPSTKDHILNILGRVVGTSALSSALCGCIALGCFGFSNFKSAVGWKDGNNYALESRGYAGLAVTALAIALTGGVLASVVGSVDDE